MTATSSSERSIASGSRWSTVSAAADLGKRRLLIARALVNDPELIVLDEPTTGLDPQARLAVWSALDSLRKRGVTLLLTTHYMEEAARLCDRLLIMDEGEIVAEGAPAALIREHVCTGTLEDVFLHLTGHALREGE